MVGFIGCAFLLEWVWHKVWHDLMTPDAPAIATLRVHFCDFYSSHIFEHNISILLKQGCISIPASPTSVAATLHRVVLNPVYCKVFSILFMAWSPVTCRHLGELLGVCVAMAHLTCAHCLLYLQQESSPESNHTRPGEATLTSHHLRFTHPLSR